MDVDRLLRETPVSLFLEWVEFDRVQRGYGSVVEMPRRSVPMRPAPTAPEDRAAQIARETAKIKRVMGSYFNKEDGPKVIRTPRTGPTYGR